MTEAITIAQEVNTAASHCITLRFLGDPAPQGSHTLTSTGYMRQASKKTMPWRHTVQYQADQQYKGQPLTGAVTASFEFIMPRAKSHYSKAKGREHELLPSAPVDHISTPDLDKLIRALFDSLQVKCGGNVLREDCQINKIKEMSKRYQAHPDEPTGVIVRLWPKSGTPSGAANL